MRAVLCKEATGHEGLVVGDVPAPTLKGPNSVRIEVHAAGLNFADTLVVAGKYQEKPALPFSPGLECSGVVLETGANVTHVKKGDRVMATTSFGAFAEEVVTDANEVYAIPDAMDFDTAASFPVAYGTSHVGLERRAALKRGETLMVHGAAGGVGLTAVEIGKAMGAVVIATARGTDKLAIAKAHGADHLIDYVAEDLRARVKEIAGDKGVDVIYDPVGGDVFDTSLRCLAWEGRLIVVGFAAGRIPQAPANLLLVKNTTVMGLFWGAYRQRNPQVLRDSFAELLSLYAAGKLKPHISHRFAIDQAPQAMATMLERRSTGKVILTIR